MGNKKLKKLLCHGVSLALVCSALAGNAGVVQSAAPVRAATGTEQENKMEAIYKNGFEDGDCKGIVARGGAYLEVSTSEHYDVGNNSFG